MNIVVGVIVENTLSAAAQNEEKIKKRRAQLRAAAKRRTASELAILRAAASGTPRALADGSSQRTLQKKRVNIKADYAKVPNKWNIS